MGAGLEDTANHDFPRSAHQLPFSPTGTDLPYPRLLVLPRLSKSLAMGSAEPREGPSADLFRLPRGSPERPHSSSPGSPLLRVAVTRCFLNSSDSRPPRRSQVAVAPFPPAPLRMGTPPPSRDPRSLVPPGLASGQPQDHFRSTPQLLRPNPGFRPADSPASAATPGLRNMERESPARVCNPGSPGCPTAHRPSASQSSWRPLPLPSRGT